MLEIKISDNFQGTSTIEGIVAERYTASIDSQNPENITFARMIINQQVRKDNREQCRADMAEFEDNVYLVQDEMIATDSKEENA